MKVVLLHSDYHQTGNRDPVATAYKVYQGEKRLNENSLYLRLMPDGRIRQAPIYEPLFGEMLHELHPTRTLDVRGQQVPCPRYCVCWAPVERYRPRSAEELAKLRASRARKKAEREDKKWAAENPLLAWAERFSKNEQADEKGRQSQELP